MCIPLKFLYAPLNRNSKVRACSAYGQVKVHRLGTEYLRLVRFCVIGIPERLDVMI